MGTEIKTISDLKTAMANNTQLQDEFKRDPIQAVNNIHDQTPLGWDVWIYRIVVFSLGATILSIIIGVLVLISQSKITDDKNVPTILTAIGSASIGALAGLLAPSPKSANS
jgi:hypothetical protein